MDWTNYPCDTCTQVIIKLVNKLQNGKVTRNKKKREKAKENIND